MSAIIKIQRNVLRRPSVNDRVPYVAMVVPLTAERVKPSCFLRVCTGMFAFWPYHPYFFNFFFILIHIFSRAELQQEYQAVV